MRLLWDCFLFTGVLVVDQVRFQASACWIYVGQRGSGVGFSSNASVLLYIIPPVLSILVYVSLMLKIAALGSIVK
jgi:hypothetical protein